MKESSLIIKNLHVSIEGKDILKGIDLEVRPGEVHAIMGPNGSGKSTLATALLGHPAYKIGSSSKVVLNGRDILSMRTDERAKSGLFLAFQSPVSVAGVSVLNVLRTGYQSIYGNKSENVKADTIQNPVLARRWNTPGISMPEFIKNVTKYAESIRLPSQFLSRSIHDGFSGGEKKKVEMLSALVLAPKYAIFDEIDTGLDVDALATVSTGIGLLRRGGTGIIVITHYQRILKYVKPDVVHILSEGKIVKTGPAILAKEIEEKGYKKFI